MDLSHSREFGRRLRKFASATMISRILGYVRDASVAYMFGGGAVTDSFYTAFRLSNLLRRLLGEGALSSSFVPIFTKSLKHDSAEESRVFVESIYTLLVVVVFVVTVLGIIFAPQLTRWIAPGFSADPNQFALTVQLTRWMFPFFFFITLAALASGILNTLKHFFLPALAPAMLSVCEISYIVLFLPVLFMLNLAPSETSKIVGLCAAVVLGGMLHWVVQIPAILKENFRLRWRWNPTHPGIKAVGLLMLPAMMGLGVDQVNAFVDTICATFLLEGSVTALYNSNRLMQLPLALFGIAMAQVALPSFSSYTAEKNYNSLKFAISDSLKMMTLFVSPATVGLVFLALPISSLLFERGNFSPLASFLCAESLVGYALGLLAYSSVKILANGFYALEEPRSPVAIAAVCMILNVCLNLILMGPWGVKGLAFATAMASWINALWLGFRLRSRLKVLIPADQNILGAGSSLWTFLLKILAGITLMILYLKVIAALDLGRGLHTLLGVVGGSFLYLVALKFLKVSELDHFLEVLHSKNK